LSRRPASVRRHDFVTATGVTVTKSGRFLQRTLAKTGTTAGKRRYNRKVASQSFVHTRRRSSRNKRGRPRWRLFRRWWLTARQCACRPEAEWSGGNIRHVKTLGHGAGNTARPRRWRRLALKLAKNWRGCRRRPDPGVENISQRSEMFPAGRRQAFPRTPARG
jgi:hypothetical protein